MISEDRTEDPWLNVVWETDANGCFNPQVAQQEMPLQYYDSASTGDTCVRSFVSVGVVGVVGVGVHGGCDGRYSSTKRLA